MRRDDSKTGPADNETWLIDTGHEIIERRRALGGDALTPRERLIHAFWVADYSMRNAGDLAAARDLDARFRETARVAAAALGLVYALNVFSLSDGELERRYFDLFDPLCDEIRGR